MTAGCQHHIQMSGLQAAPPTAQVGKDVDGSAIVDTQVRRPNIRWFAAPGELEEVGDVTAA